MEYEAAVAFLKQKGWTTRHQSVSKGGIDVVTVWCRAKQTLVTVWYPGRGQYEIFESSPQPIEKVAA